jgi:beta-lactamase class D
MNIRILFFVLFYIFSVNHYSQSIMVYDSLRIEEIDLSSLFPEMEGTFVLLDTGNNSLTVYNPSRMKEAFLPASTFKIPNTVIGLEEGILKDDDNKTEWDSLEVQWKSRWPQSWKKGQTLESAFRNSVV